MTRRKKTRIIIYEKQNIIMKKNKAIQYGKRSVKEKTIQRRVNKERRKKLFKRRIIKCDKITEIKIDYEEKKKKNKNRRQHKDNN